MKFLKLVILIYILLLHTPLILAQDFMPGIKGGFGISTIRGSEGKSKISPCYHIGFFNTIYMSKQINLKLEVCTSLQGGAFEATNAPYFTTHTLSSNDSIKYYEVPELKLRLKLFYVNIPLLLDVDMYEGFHLVFGSQIGLLIAANEKITGRVARSLRKIDKTLQRSYISSSYFNTFDYYAIAGIEYITLSDYCIGVRFNYGFYNIAKSITTFNLEMKNLSIELSVGKYF